MILQCKHVAIGLIAVAILGCSATQPIRWVSTPEYDVEYDLAWDVTVGLIGEHFSIETAEKKDGYLQTAWKIVEPSAENAEILEDMDRVGVRLTCRVEGRFPFQLKMKVERGLFRDGAWVPIWVDYSREAICQSCSGSQEWIDEKLEREIGNKIDKL